MHLNLEREKLLRLISCAKLFHTLPVSEPIS